MYISVIAIVLVAGFGIFNIISNSVQEKYRDIAIMRSIGFSHRDIKSIFIFQGIVVGIVGMFVGWLLGYLAVEFLAGIKFEMKRGSRGGMATMEGFNLYRSAWQYVVGGAIALATSTLASFLPAKKAAKVNPVDIIRGSSL